MAGQGTEGAVGLTQILAETGQNLLGMRIDVEASRRATRRIDRALRRGRLDRVERAAGAAPRGRRALRPREGARRHRALPGDRAAALRPRRPRLRLLPHGHGQPRDRAARLQRPAERRRSATWCPTRGCPTRRSTSTRRRGAMPPRSGASRASATTPRTTCGSWAPRATIMRLARNDPAELERLAGAADREELRRGGPAPARDETPRFADADGAARGVGRRRHHRACPTARGHRPRARRRAWARSPAARRSRAGLYRGLHPAALAAGALHRRAGARGQPAPRRSSSPRPCATSATSACSRAATARRRATTRCTRPAGRSTSRASTAPGARRSPSSPCSTACRRST